MDHGTDEAHERKQEPHMTIPYLYRARTMAIAMFMGMYCGRSNAQVTTEVEWQRCIGGSDYEFGSSLEATSDGGFICVGWSTSTDGDAIGSHGATDVLVTKLNADGAVLWRRVLGGSSEEQGFDCMEASDGSIMIAGSTYSTDGDVTANQGEYDLSSRIPL